MNGAVRASAIPLHQAAFRELLGSHSVHGPDENGNLANFSTVELVSLPDSLSGCPHLCDVVPESLRHYLENIQSTRKTMAVLENMQAPPAAYWDQVLKGNRAKRMRRLDFFGLVRRGLRNIFSESSLSTGRAETSDPGCPDCELGVCVPARRESLFLQKYGSN